MKRFRGLRGKQRECFEQIATGRVMRHNPRTLGALADKELIRYETQRFPLDGFGTLVVDVPYVPLAIHQEGCEWRAEQRTIKAGDLIYTSYGTAKALPANKASAGNAMSQVMK